MDLDYSADSMTVIALSSAVSIRAAPLGLIEERRNRGGEIDQGHSSYFATSIVTADLRQIMTDLPESILYGELLASLGTKNRFTVVCCLKGSHNTLL